MKYMGDFAEQVPKHIRRLVSYQPGKSQRQAREESGLECIKLASNENPFGPSPRAIEAINHAALNLHLYPDNDNLDLRLRLATLYEMEPDQVLVTAGSTAFLDIISRTLLAPGLNAVTSERSFIMYPVVTHAAGAELIEAPMRGDRYDLDALLAAIDRRTRVVFLANPNNPTGTVVSAREVERFLDRVPERVTVVLDEAYYDFASYFARLRGFDYSRSLDYVRQGRNVVVLRTFSKTHGLAGLRIGYGFAPAAFLKYLARMRTVFSVTSIAEAGALAALDDHAHVRLTLENNVVGAQWLGERIAEMGLRSGTTWANFLYIELGEDAGRVADKLQDCGVIVRPLSAWGAPTAMRVTIGTPGQNEKFLAALKSSVGESLRIRS
jgi:histidinol-phosphate aminotransferase